MIRAGRLKEIAVVQRPVRVKTASGGFTTTYQDVLNPMYCDVQLKQPSTDVIAAQENWIQPFVFVARHRTDIVLEIGDRIVWRSRHFVLTGFKWDINRTELIITAKTDNETTDIGNGEGS